MSVLLSRLATVTWPLNYRCQWSRGGSRSVSKAPKAQRLFNLVLVAATTVWHHHLFLPQEQTMPSQCSTVYLNCLFTCFPPMTQTPERHYNAVVRRLHFLFFHKTTLTRRMPVWFQTVWFESWSVWYKQMSPSQHICYEGSSANASWRASEIFWEAARIINIVWTSLRLGTLKWIHAFTGKE